MPGARRGSRAVEDGGTLAQQQSPDPDQNAWERAPNKVRHLIKLQGKGSELMLH